MGSTRILRALTALMAAGALVLTVGSCGDDDDSATQESRDVTMTWIHPGEGPYQGAVTLEGGAVDAGLMCSEAEGTEVEFSELESDEDSITLRLDAMFTCTDGSGDFVVRDDGMVAVVDGVPADDAAGPWTIVSGTGDYATLSGSGDATTVFVAGEITKTYTGEMSLD